MNNAAAQFVKEAYAELRKSTWLTRKEAVDSTKVVVVIVVIFALFVAGIDFLLSIVMTSVLGGR